MKEPLNLYNRMEAYVHPMTAEEIVEFTRVDIQLENGQLTIKGQPVSDLFAKAEREPAVTSFREVTAALPSEDLTPGHIMPAVVLTTSRAS